MFHHNGVITKELLDVLDETILLFLRQVPELSTEMGKVEDSILSNRTKRFP